MCIRDRDESIEGWEPATHDELHHVKYPPDVAKLVQEATSKTTSDGIDLQKDIQPYDAESDGVCELASETAEWWGPEWCSEDAVAEARYGSMTPVCPPQLFLQPERYNMAINPYKDI